MGLLRVAPVRHQRHGLRIGNPVHEPSRADFSSLPVCLPSQEVLRAFGEWTQPIHDRRDAGDDENGTLASLRGSLLPKLISGELRVPDAERTVGGATVMDLDTQKEQFSRAYVQAVAACAGFAWRMPSVDDGGSWSSRSRGRRPARSRDRCLRVSGSVWTGFLSSGRRRG